MDRARVKRTGHSKNGGRERILEHSDRELEKEELDTYDAVRLVSFLSFLNDKTTEVKTRHRPRRLKKSQDGVVFQVLTFVT